MADEAVVGAEGAAVETGAPVEIGEPTEGATGVAAGEGLGEPEDDRYTVVVGGREERVTFDDLTKGYMRQADYTRKTQELAREREQVSELQALRNALERDPRTTLVALAGALGVDIGTASQVAAQALQQEEVDPLQALTSQVEKLTGTLTAQQQAAIAAQQQAQVQAAMQEQITREISDMKNLYGEFDDQALIQYAVQHQTPNLDIAYRAWQFELAKQADAAERNRILEEKRKAQVVEGGRNAAGGSVVPAQNQKMTIREAFQAALASPHQ